jgi:plasmid stabilization system protein ParE
VKHHLQVRVTEMVNSQIVEQVLYVAADSISAALNWEDRLRASIDNLGNFYGHAVDQEASERVGGTVRKFVFEKTYLVHYEVDAEAGVVYVINLRHGSRLPRTGEP